MQNLKTFVILNCNKGFVKKKKKKNCNKGKTTTLFSAKIIKTKVFKRNKANSINSHRENPNDVIL